MSENFVFSSFQKPNRVTKNAALCVEERHALTVSRQTGGDLVFLVQGSYTSWKTWNILEFDNWNSRP